MTNSMIHEPKFHLGASGDYLRIECTKCNERCTFKFKGFDPAIPLAEIICPVHGSIGTWKIDGYDPVGSSKGRKQFGLQWNAS